MTFLKPFFQHFFGLKIQCSKMIFWILKVLSLQPVLYRPEVDNRFNFIAAYFCTSLLFGIFIQFFQVKCFFLFLKQWPEIILNLIIVLNDTERTVFIFCFTDISTQVFGISQYFFFTQQKDDVDHLFAHYTQWITYVIHPFFGQFIRCLLAAPARQ